MDDGHLIVLVDDFQIIDSHFSRRGPIQRLLFAYNTYVGFEPESSVKNSPTLLESLLAKPSCHALNTSEPATIGIPPIGKEAALYYTGT